MPDKQLTISFLLSSLWLSGGVRDIVEQANGLTRKGHQVTLVFPAGTYDADIAHELQPQIQLIASQAPRTAAMNPWQKLRLAWSMAAAAPASDIIISTHTPTTLSGLFATRLLKRGQPIWYYQDYREMFAGRVIEDWLLRHALRWHHAALTLSHFSKEELGRYGSGRIVVSGAGLRDAEYFQPLPFAQRPAHTRHTVLFLGDMRPRKGLFDFLEAMELVQREVPDLKLWIVSKEDCQIESSIPFDYIYRPSPSELAQLYQQCHVFVSASWWESFGFPPLEAMACGAPVVLTNSGGVLDYARPDENCLLTPIRDPIALANAVIRVLQDEDLANRLSANGPLMARHFRWETAVDRFEQTLLELVN